MSKIKNPLDTANTAVDTADKAANAAGKFKKIVDEILGGSPTHRAKQLFIQEIENDPDLTTSEKMAYLYSYKSIVNQIKNTDQIYTLADLKMKERGKSIEDELPKLDEDWLNYYNDVIKNFSNEGMQAIWASILAGECNNKGSISKKLISILQTIDLKTAKDFSFLCSHSVIVYDEYEKNLIPIFPRLFEVDFKDNLNIQNYLSTIPINSIDLSNLQIMGLITFDDSDSSCYYIEDNKAEVLYYETKLKIKSDKNILVGKVLYTAYGNELAWLLHDVFRNQKDDKYIEFVQNYLKNLNPSIEIETL